MNRRDFLRAAGLTAAVLQVDNGAAMAYMNEYFCIEKKPNIVFILADDLGYGDIGIYGQEKILTPNIDKMAKEGMKFTSAYAGSPICAPSRCSLTTGLHTGHCRIRGNWAGNSDNRIMNPTPLLAQDKTIFEVLKKAGYTTGLIGKWGLGETDNSGAPNKKGIDYFFGYLDHIHAHDYFTDHLFRNDKRIEIPQGTYTHDLFTQESEAFIEKHKDKPFCLFITYTIPHANNESPDPENGMQIPSIFPYSSTDWPPAEKGKAAMISRMDSDIGKIDTILKRFGLEDDTIVIFASDNGPHKEGGVDPNFFKSSGPLRGIKRDLYDGGIRVPFIVKWKNKVFPTTVTDHVCAFWDVMPTLCDIAGIKTPNGIDGISFLPTLLAKTQKQHDYLYWEYHEYVFAQAIRKDEWKAIRRDYDKPIELYNLVSDIGETVNLAAKYPEIVKNMDGIMKTARTKSEFWP